MDKRLKRTQIKIREWEGKLYDSIKKRKERDIAKANQQLDRLYEKEDQILYPNE